MRIVRSTLLVAAFAIAAPASAATVGYTDPAAFAAAVPGLTIIEDYEGGVLETTIADGAVYNSVRYDFSGGRSGRIGNTYFNIGAQSLHAAGSPNFFDEGESFTIHFAAPVNAVGGYFNIAPSTFEAASLTAAGGSIAGAGPADTADFGTFYFLGLLSDTAFSSATFAVATGSASGWNFDNLIARVAVADAIPEPATWGTMILGFTIVGAVMRRRQQSERVYRAA